MRDQAFCLGKTTYRYLAQMCITEIQGMDITQFPINNTMTKESNEKKTKTFVFVKSLKKAVLNGSTRSRFKYTFWKFSSGWGGGGGGGGGRILP